MADLQQLYSALEKADAAGDVASAKQLADWIRAEQGGFSPAAPEKLEQSPVEPATGFSSFIPAVKRGALGLQSLVADVAPAMAGRVAERLNVPGAKEYADRQMREAQEAQEYIQQRYPAAVSSYKDIKGGGDLLTYVVESVGELLPSMIPSVLTGGAAGIAGRGAAIAAREAAEKASLETAKKSLLTYSGSKLSQQELVNLATADAIKAGQAAAQKAVLKYQAAGAIGGSAMQNVPEVYQNIAEETGKEDLGAALLFGGFNSVLDAITPITLLRKAKGVGLTEKELIGAWYKRAGKGVLTGFATEGATEAVQEMSSAAAEKFVDENKNFFTEKNFERFINAGLKGGIGGGAVSGVANIPFGRKEEPPTPSIPETPEAVTPAMPGAEPAKQGALSNDDIEKFLNPEAKEEVKKEEAKKVDLDSDTFDMPTASEKIASLKADNDRIQNKLATGQYKNAPAVSAANAKIARQKAEIETLEAKLAEGDKNVTDRTDVTGGGVSAEISSGPKPSGTPEEIAASERSGVVDAGSAAEQAAVGDAKQQGTLTPTKVIHDKEKDVWNYNDDKELVESAGPTTAIQHKSGIAKEQGITKTYIDGNRVTFELDNGGDIAVKFNKGRTSVYLNKPDKMMGFRPAGSFHEDIDSIQKDSTTFGFDKLQDFVPPKLARAIQNAAKNISSSTKEVADPSEFIKPFLKEAVDSDGYSALWGEREKSAEQFKKELQGQGTAPTTKKTVTPTTTKKEEAPVDQATLVIPPGNKEVATEVTPPKAEFKGESAFTSGTERRFIEPKVTEETLYPKAIALREAQKLKPKPTVEEVAKTKQSVKNVKEAATDVISGKTADRYNALTPEEKTMVDTAVAKYKSLLEFKEAKPMSKRKEGPPPGVTYKPRQYNKILKEEKAAAEKAAKEPPVPKRLSLIEERMAELRAIPSYGSVNLEAIEGLRGGTTIGLMSNLMHGDLRGALQEIAQDTSGQFTKLDRMVAKRLLQSDTLPTLRVVPTSELNGKLGQYDAATDIASISEDAMTSHVVLHETLHGFTLAIIKAHKDGVKFNQGVANLEKLYNHLKETYPDLKDKYGMKNLAEFVSEAMSNPEFQEQLNALPYERGNLVINAFVEFVKDVLNVLGIGPGKDFTALAYALVSAESILTEGRRLEATNPPPATAALAPDATAKPEPEPPTYKEGTTNLKEWATSIPKVADTPAASIKKALGENERYGTFQLVAKLLQNSRRAIQNWENRLEKAKKIMYYGENQNNIFGDISASSGRAEHFFNFYLATASKDLYDAIGRYANARGLSDQDALIELQQVFVSLHEPERRRAKYVLNVPLPLEAAMERKKIMSLVRSNQINEEQAERLRARLDALVENPANKLKEGVKGYGANPDEGFSYLPQDEQSAYYNVVSGIDPKVFKMAITELYEPNKALIDPIQKAIKVLQKGTKELDTRANYWAQPVNNVVAFYGYDNYVPFKGKPGETQSKIDDELEPHGKVNGRELQEAPFAFEGRLSDPDNPLLQTLADGVRSALRAGRGGTMYGADGKPLLDSKGEPTQFGTTHAIVNAIKQGLIEGKPVETISFAQRYDAAVLEKLKQKGENNFFHYKPDGSIEIWSIEDKALREAIRRTYQQNNPLVDTFSRITSWIGQGHTRYNPAFAPKNFVADTLANAGIIGAELGVSKFGGVIGEVAKNGLGKAFTFSRLYGAKNFAEIERLAKTDDYIKDMYEYVKGGGKVSYVSGIGAQSQFQRMQETLGRSKIASTKEQIDSVIDTFWAEPFELASRVAAYRVTKADYINNQKMSPEAAKTKAISYVKNLANFEQTGDYGKALGAFFVFFRASATGAVRAIDALAPIFVDPNTEFLRLPESVRLDPEAKKTFFENHYKQRRTAQAMLAAIAGTGVMVYYMALLMSDDDDEGRNRTAIDDMDRWTRFARFPIPGTDVIVQIPWGFGLGAFAAAGAQVASLLVGNSSFGQVFNNIKDVGMDSFLPLPTSKINMFENPAAWAMDSITPSIARPFFEYAMNLDGLGREIYNNRQSRVGDAYTGGDNIPELYKDAARMLANITNGGIDVSPNTMYFFANNYVDGLSRIIHNSYGIGMTAAGQKQFNPKTDTMILDSFFGAPSNVDAREFSKVENQIKEKERKLNMFKSDPMRYAEYVAANPFDETIVQIYNQSVGAGLNKLREQSNMYRKMPDLSPKERKELVDIIKSQENLYKRHLISVFEAYNITP